MASTSGEFSVVHYFDAEKNDLMFVRFWVNCHEVLMPLSELVYGLEDGKDIESAIPEGTSEQNPLVNNLKLYKELHRVPNGGTLRRCDSDNKASSILDLLVDLGVIEDDSWQVVRSLSVTNYYEKAKPSVTVKIFPYTEEFLSK